MRFRESQTSVKAMHYFLHGFGAESCLLSVKSLQMLYIYFQQGRKWKPSIRVVSPHSESRSFAEGARVMITHNVWTSKGLMSGAQGTIKKSGFDQGLIHSWTFLLLSLSSAMKVSILGTLSTRKIIEIADVCIGPVHPAWDGVEPFWVPLVPVTFQWDDGMGKSLTWMQLPLATAWAITIHKSQGLISKKAVN
ncbi:hypothetical protein C8R43DRAFT_560987 [Mycena crocata]|nr:hypothetical protein C8R43DRAFT_560987 [Mycena crocata]